MEVEKSMSIETDIEDFLLVHKAIIFLNNISIDGGVLLHECSIVNQSLPFSKATDMHLKKQYLEVKNSWKIKTLEPDICFEKVYEAIRGLFVAG